MARRNDSPTLYLYVKEYIMKLIISGKYPANTQLPTEYQLMDELNVGRATVRAALAQLENEGTIYKRQGVGTFVSERSQHFGLEPFMSLSFTLKRVGIKDTNEVINKERYIVEDGELAKGWPKGTEVYRIQRLRSSEDTPIALEDNYYSPYAFSKLKEDEIDQSLSHNLLSSIDSTICDIDMHISVRHPSQEECQQLNIKPQEKVVDISRWMFVEAQDSPINYASMIIPSHVLEFPFLG